MKLRTWRYFINQGLNNILRNSVMSIASVMSMVAAFFVLGVVLLIVLNLNHIVQGIESKMEVTVFLKDGTHYEQISEMEYRMANWQGVTGVVFVSRHEALAEWKKELGDQGELLEGYTYENNPLLDYFIIEIAKPEYVDGIARNAESMEWVENVSYSWLVVEFIERVAVFVRVAGMGMVAILLVVAVTIMNNTIRIAVFARKREIGIMKYIGATNWFIRWPFVIEGFILGLLGALLSVILISGIYYILILYSQGMLIEGFYTGFLEPLQLEVVVRPMIKIILPLGGGVGVLASVISIRKYLNV